jgi:hypothetical protein
MLVLTSRGQVPEPLACTRTLGKERNKTQQVPLHARPATNLFRGSLERFQVVSDIFEFLFQVPTFSANKTKDLCI